MASLPEYMREYKKQLEKGYIQKAYKGLMEYIMSLKTHFKNKYPDYFVSGNIYTGYMDMTYFSFIPERLKMRNLKIAVVFKYTDFRFEVWLSGYNKKVQAEYLQLFNNSHWTKYHNSQSLKSVDYILDHTLVENPDFGDPSTLTEQIELGTLNFIRDVEDFLSKR